MPEVLQGETEFPRTTFLFLHDVGKVARKMPQALLLLDPRFFVAPYIGKHGWTSMRTAGRIDWREVEDLVRESFRRVATKSMLAKLEGTRSRPKKKKKK